MIALRGLPALLLALVLTAPVTAEGFAGTFADQGMVLTLKTVESSPPAAAQGAGDRYAGTLVYDGHAYDLEAEAADGELHGSFAADKGRFEFRARLTGEVLELETNTVTYRLRRRMEAYGEASAPGLAAPSEEPPPQPGPAAAGERDASLVGVWRRQPIAADAGGRLPDAVTVELAADGSYAIRGGAVERTGRWHTDGPVLLLRPAGADIWQPYCRYRVVADTLLCSFDDGSRQLWFRR